MFVIYIPVLYPLTVIMLNALVHRPEVNLCVESGLRVLVKRNLEVSIYRFGRGISKISGLFARPDMSAASSFAIFDFSVRDPVFLHLFDPSRFATSLLFLQLTAIQTLIINSLCHAFRTNRFMQHS